MKPDLSDHADELQRVLPHACKKICSLRWYSGSCNLLKLCEISADISETVQDRNIVTMEDIDKCSSNRTLIGKYITSF